jgi:hypothetical protein
MADPLRGGGRAMVADVLFDIVPVVSSKDTREVVAPHLDSL